MMKKHAVAAIAGAILGATATPTFASTALAQLSNFQIQLVDLNLADGIAPTITFQDLQGGPFVAAESGAPSDVVTDVNVGGVAFGAASSTSARGGASAYSWLSGDPFGTGAGATASASTSHAGVYGASTVWLGDGATYVPFTLSADTRLVITADASASAMSTFGGLQADTWASVFLKLSDATGQDGLSEDRVSAEQVGAPASVPFATTDAHRIEITFENLSGLSMDGIFSGSVDAYSADLSPAPEPGGLALMLSGLGMLAWRGRRRVR